MNKKEYTLGLIFTPDQQKILLLEKNERAPKWMQGRWNGIGGKIEKNEAAFEGIQREAFEEANIEKGVWNYVITLEGTEFKIYIYTYFCLEEKIKEQETREGFLKWHLVNNLPLNIVDNLKWLIPMALETKDMFGKLKKPYEYYVKEIPYGETYE